MMPPTRVRICEGNSTPDSGKIIRVGLGPSVITWVGIGVFVGGMGVFVAVGSGVPVAVGLGVLVGVGVLVGLGVPVGVGVLVGIGVLVGGMGVAVGASQE